jgi:CarboxypepD_reg-like domain
MFISFFSLTQVKERLISGQLKSTDDGAPLLGVNVFIKGTNKEAVTDMEGRYSLPVPIGSVLVFSFIGMQTREV